MYQPYLLIQSSTWERYQLLPWFASNIASYTNCNVRFQWLREYHEFVCINLQPQSMYNPCERYTSEWNPGWCNIFFRVYMIFCSLLKNKKYYSGRINTSMKLNFHQTWFDFEKQLPFKLPDLGAQNVMYTSFSNGLCAEFGELKGFSGFDLRMICWLPATSIGYTQNWKYSWAFIPLLAVFIIEQSGLLPEPEQMT